jgi:hypothetical protein
MLTFHTHEYQTLVLASINITPDTSGIWTSTTGTGGPLSGKLVAKPLAVL